MRRSLFPSLILVVFLVSACSDRHLINSRDYRKTVESDFRERKKLAVNREKALFSVLDNIEETQRREALQFLFAYMPLSDLADYSGEFFLANSDAALKARSETSWGDSIPEDIFLHYVLPYRVNNENPDSFRIVFYDEIMERVRGLSMKNAALEINHWCHEKVAYQPADIRTSAPMSTVLSARGRCGEESTFTVASLRTAGIPARQVYTPRWAHTDDNHAWVEFWVDGEWHYMGACEPEPIPDLGWFTEPARRAMLVHTKSFGACYGNENFIRKTRYYSEVNNLQRYAPVKRLIVKVTDPDDKPVADALVEFKLYNYAEFYTLAAVPTDGYGLSSLETGSGDLLVWASHGKGFNYIKVSGHRPDTVRLKLRTAPADNEEEILDISVPPVQTPFPGLPADVAAKNKIRFEEENSIRQAYIDSWISKEASDQFAKSVRFDSIVIWDILSRSMGNYAEIMSFLKNSDDIDNAVAILKLVNDKDLRDTRANILNDHLRNILNPYGLSVSDNLFLSYVLNPRVANEMLMPYRAYFYEVTDAEMRNEAITNPAIIASYLDSILIISDEDNYYKTPLTPVGVHELKVTDRESRRICFVAVCRSLGIPSRLEPGSNRPQYYSGSEWHDVYFRDESIPGLAKGFVRMHSPESNPIPEYYTHFTLARFENGRYLTLEFDYGRKVSDFKEEISLIPGNYLLVTGNRQTDGNVLAALSFFTLAPGEHLDLEIRLRKINTEKGSVPLINTRKLEQLLKAEPGSIRDGKGVLMAVIEPDREPSVHLIKELCLISRELKTWGGSLVIMVSGGSEFDPSLYEGFPQNPLILNTGKGNVIQDLFLPGQVPEFIWPLVLLTDTKGSVVFHSSGYRIGTGDQIIRHLLKK